MMKVIFTSNRIVDFIIRLLITAIVISVIIWSWDTVKETILDGDACRCFRYPTPVCSCLFCILFFCPTDLQKPDERKMMKGMKMNPALLPCYSAALFFFRRQERCRRLAVV